MSVLSGIACSTGAAAGNFPDPKTDLEAVGAEHSIVLAGGCFWCTEAVFEQLNGVKNVVSGYAGGTADTARYDAVSAGGTRHAEAIRITYDPSKISYGALLKVFFSVAHDPTQLNRQGPDWGKQYRSAVFYASADEKKVAQAYIAQLTEARIFDKKIVTTLEPLEKFYPSEEYHQDYVARNPMQPYVLMNARPKVNKVRKEYAERIKK